MACNKSVKAYYSKTVNEGSGKRSLVFNRRDRYLGNDSRYAGSLEIPCGKCLGCKTDQSLMWSIRAYHESTLHEQNCFVTLTYDEEHLPKDGKINKRDLQLFFKRLRKQIDSRLFPTKIRYIACGEYGAMTRRPHYHAIIFGLDFLEGAESINSELYTNSKLVDAWQNGHVSIAPVNMASICYVCGYVNKKIDDPDTFSLMSRRPGIGHDWLDRYAHDVATIGVVTIEGKAYQVPKRYLEWSEEMLAGVKRDRMEYAKKKQRDVDYLTRFSQGLSREEKMRCKAKAKKVQLGQVFGQYVEVINGLGPADQVILSRDVLDDEPVKTN